MKGSALKNLHIFTTLCGQEAMPNVIIVTTKWGEVDIEQGVRWEKELKADFWKDMIATGCGTTHFKDTYDSVWSIISRLGDRHWPPQVLLQHKIVDSELQLPNTQAGITLSEEVEELTQSQKEMDDKLRRVVHNRDNEVVIQELNEQPAEIERTADQLRETKNIFASFSRAATR
jgi:hypothetical protein